jgi:hypothetical protein
MFDAVTGAVRFARHRAGRRRAVGRHDLVLAHALACTAGAVTGSYLAVFHSPRALPFNIPLFNIAAALATAVVAAYRLAEQTHPATAVTAFWLMWLLNIAVPLAIRGASKAMSQYAMRSHQDPLTGPLNRRGFIDAVSRRIVAGMSQSDPACLLVLMIDLDKFKQVNDTHGHAATTPCCFASPNYCASAYLTMRRFVAPVARSFWSPSSTRCAPLCPTAPTESERGEDGEQGERDDGHDVSLREFHEQHGSPRHAFRPSRTAIAAMPSAATGSAHDHPHTLLSIRPASRIAER